MQVKYLLNTTYRIRGFHLVFEPGGVYDIDPATVASMGLLNKTDGFGGKVFEAVKQPRPVESSEPIPTPEDVFLANKKARDEALAKEQAEKLKARREKAAKEVADRKDRSAVLRAVAAVKPEPAEVPPEEAKEEEPPAKGKGKGKTETPTGKGKGRSKLSERLRATPH